MSRVFIVLVGIIAIVWAATVIAVPPDKKVEYDGGAMGNVVFEGKTHADAGLECSDCHPDVFQKMKGEATMKPPHRLDEFCGVCHNGEKAPSVQGNCMKCHRE